MAASRLEKLEKLNALLVDLGRRATGIVKRENLTERRTKVGTSSSIFLVNEGCVLVPKLRDVADRKALTRAKLQELDASPQARVLSRALLLKSSGLPHERDRPGAIEDAGHRRVFGLELVGFYAAATLPFALLADSTFGTQSHVTRHAVEESTKARRAILLDAIEDAVVAKALHEDLLHDIVELFDES